MRAIGVCISNFTQASKNPCFKMFGTCMEDDK